jgi:hypothetical protein
LQLQDILSERDNVRVDLHGILIERDDIWVDLCDLRHSENISFVCREWGYDG